MLVKSTLIFLLGMMLIAMIGRALFPGGLVRSPQRRPPPAKPATCGRCGRYIIGSGPCDCGGPARKA